MDTTNYGTLEVVENSKGKMKKSDSEDEPLLDGESSGDASRLRIQPGRTIVVEPLLVLYSLAGMPLSSLKSQYMYQKIALDMGIDLKNLSSNGTSACLVNKSDAGYIARESVQAANTDWNVYMSLANFLPAVVMILVYGSYSDKVGRRLALISPVIGSISTIILQMAIVYFDLPIWCFLFGAIEYVFGGFYVMITGTFAYIADTVPKEKRAVRMTILDALIIGMAAVGNVIVGYMIDAMGYFYPYLFCLGGKLLTLTYAVFFIPETVRKPEPSQRTPSEFCQTIKNGIKLYLVDNGTGRRIQLQLLLLSYVLGDLISSMSILTLYEMNVPLCWNSVYIGYFGAASDLIKCAGTIVAAFVLKRFMSEKWLTALGISSNVFYYIYLAFVFSTTMMFFAPVVGSLSFLSLPMTRALMSKLVRLDEQGSLFAVMMVMGNTAYMFSTLTTNKIYAATLYLMEGFIFLVGAVTKVLSLLVLLCYIYKSRNTMKPLVRAPDIKA